MSNTSSRGRFVLTSISAVMVLSVALAMPGSSVAQPPPPMSPLQKALNETQQDLMNLKKNLETDGRTTRQSTITELGLIAKVLEMQLGRSAPGDPGRAGVIQTLGNLGVLINALQNLQIPGRNSAAAELDLLIGIIDGWLGKWR
ncbi:MAG: hypothetical protein AB7I30_13790 [Isosphaeraceae bacterium]